MTSISWYIEENEIYIYCDNGRLTRPLYIYENNEMILQNNDIKSIKEGKKQFIDLLQSKLLRRDDITPFNTNNYLVETPEILKGINKDSDNLWSLLSKNSAAIEYIDIKEMDNSLLTLNFDINPTDKYTYSHADLHPIIILGYMGLYGILLNHGQSGKYLASGASKHPKQSVSVYTSEYSNKFYSSAHLAHNIERPIIQNRFHKIINNDKYGTGTNVIVAISYQNGYNQEDAFIFNKSSIDMGLYNSSYYKTYQETEKSDMKTGTEEKFYNPMYSSEITEYPDELSGNFGKYNFEYLDKYGIIKEGTYLTGDEVLIGKYAKIKDVNGSTTYTDLSSHVKKDNKNSYVDKVFTCKTNAAGDELCKVRTCQLRVPQLGDKFASRNGQKGTIGVLIDKPDMPFTKTGIVPDIILHPASYPTRMTLNQLFEIIYGKLASEMGFFGLANTLEPFDVKKINNIMEENGFQYGGDEFLYDGISGKMMPAKIFIGPLYMQRLKLMVNDKINTRTSGQKRDGIPIPGASYTTLDRSVISGRAAGGGLKIGEMERDALIGQGLSSFINDRDMVRGDKFSVYVSPVTGQIVVGNDYDGIFYDNSVDGPISYQLSETSTSGNRKILGINNFNIKQHNFIKVNIPYSTKLLIQEMQGVGYNVQIKPEMNKFLIDTDKLINYTNSNNNSIKDLSLQTSDLSFQRPDINNIENNNKKENISEVNPIIPQKETDLFSNNTGIESIKDPQNDFIRTLKIPEFNKSDKTESKIITTEPPLKNLFTNNLLSNNEAINVSENINNDIKIEPLNEEINNFKLSGVTSSSDDDKSDSIQEEGVSNEVKSIDVSNNLDNIIETEPDILASPPPEYENVIENEDLFPKSNDLDEQVGGDSNTLEPQISDIKTINVSSWL